MASEIRLNAHEQLSNSWNFKVTPEDSLVSKYLVVHNTSDLIDFIDLDPALALRGIYGSESTILFQKFLRSDFDRQKVTEILFYVKYKVETRTFPSDTKLTTHWQKRPQKYVGTHYVKSITSGGRLLLSFQIHPMEPEYLEEVRNAIASHLGKSGIIDENLTEKLENLCKALELKAYVRNQGGAYGIDFRTLPSKMEEVSRFALQFPAMVKNTGDGKGSALDLEVVDLHTVAPNFKEYKTNPDLAPVLREAFAKFDDICIAKSELESWMDSKFLLEEPSEEVNAFSDKIRSAYRAMSSAIDRLDVAGPVSQFDAAFQAYGKGEGSDKYITELRELMKSIVIYWLNHHNDHSGDCWGHFPWPCV
ncbi:uncharacterized protein TNCT_549821 [Trichonephila clavata]|uniref:Uncharacterized protein n=1 Tax=Trichonephila clavata TaxID=2740835 RepID=A0A8X6FZ95_TRICU|nr:uncharacterized protein TNCT_549821 [Trichonephila clavata]